ncbi:MAG: HEAT repeat domain-containing protein [Chloroflexota bacterium]|nr:HEAT repeat domain-containing protein [Chloroflexota bacterium]
MNCQEFSRLVGHTHNNSVAGLSGVMDAHLRQCDPCRAEWESWREIAALEIPATPDGLGSRILEAISRTQQEPRRHFRPFVVGGGVLGCLAAAAAIVAWKMSSGPAPQVALAPEASSGIEMAEAIVPELVAAQPQPVTDEEAAKDAASTEAVTVANPLRFLVVFRPETGADAQAVAATSQCHDAVVNHMRAVPQFEVIASGAAAFAPASTFGPTDDQKRAARAQGAGHVLVISTEMGCDASLFEGGTGNLVPGAGGQLLAFEGYRPSAARLAQQMREKFLFTPEDLWAEARKKVLDTTLPERERLGSLWSFGQYRSMDPSLARRALDSEVIAAAAALATNTADPDVRESIWAVLRGTRDNQIVRPLLKALATDPAASIRMQAAFSLRPFLDEPGVREALLRAAAEDPDSVPAVACCIYTVREAAERATVPDSQFREWVRGKLYDESLPVRSRLRHLAPSSMDGRFLFLRDVEFGAEAARVVFDLGRQSQDPGIRLMAWDILGHAKPDASFIPQLISDLKDHPDEYVRANAAKLLFPQASDPAVSKALEAARNDPSPQVRIAANGVQRPFRP